MTSILSSYAAAKSPPTKFFDIVTGAYSENIIVGGYDIPIPFTFINGILDINVNQSADVQTFVTNGNTPLNSVNFQGKVMGGAYLVNFLGSNVSDWLRKLIENQEGLGGAYTGPLDIYVKPVMTKIQLAAPAQGVGPLNDESVWGITTEAPASDGFIGGDSTNNFFTCFVFKTPMTIRYEITGVGYKYFTMTSQFSAN